MKTSRKEKAAILLGIAIIYFRCNKKCTEISLDTCVRYFLIFDKFLNWVVIKYYSQTPGFAGGDCQPCITHIEVAEEWTSTVHREDKHDFSLIVISEFQLVSANQDDISWDLPRVRIDMRGSEKPTGLTALSFIERSLKMH